MVLTEPSTDALSRLFSIEYKRDYPQTQIILKKATDCSSYREGPVAFEDNNLVQSTKF